MNTLTVICAIIWSIMGGYYLGERSMIHQLAADQAASNYKLQQCLAQLKHEH